jgi:hypothetical protein
LCGDIGDGDGSRQIYRHLVETGLKQKPYTELLFHSLQPDIFRSREKTIMWLPTASSSMLFQAPVSETMEPIGGTGDSLAGVAAVLIASGMRIPSGATVTKSS